MLTILMLMMPMQELGNDFNRPVRVDLNPDGTSTVTHMVGTAGEHEKNGEPCQVCHAMQNAPQIPPGEPGTFPGPKGKDGPPGKNGKPEVVYHVVQDKDALPIDPDIQFETDVETIRRLMKENDQLKKTLAQREEATEVAAEGRSSVQYHSSPPSRQQIRTRLAHQKRARLQRLIRRDRAAPKWMRLAVPGLVIALASIVLLNLLEMYLNRRNPTHQNSSSTTSE